MSSSYYNTNSSRRNNPQNNAPRNDDGCMKKEVRRAILISVGVLFTIIAIGLIGGSFPGVELGEYGLKKVDMSGKVDKDGRVYTAGRYGLGPHIVFEKFDAYVQQDIFKLSISTDNGRELTLKCGVFYYIIKDELGELFKKFNVGWESQAKTKITSTIKTSAQPFSVDQYVTNLEHIEQVIQKALQDILKENHLMLDDHKFVIMEVDFSERVDTQFLRNAIQNQKNEQEDIQKRVELIVQDTTTMAEAIRANKTLTEQTGQAEADKIVAEAEARSKTIVDVATAESFNEFFNHFGVSDASVRARYLEWQALQNKDLKLLFGIDSALVQV